MHMKYHATFGGSIKSYRSKRRVSSSTVHTFSSPSVKRVQKAVMLSALMMSLSGLNFVISSSRVMRRMAGHSSFFSPKNSRMRWLSSTSLSMKMNRICGETRQTRHLPLLVLHSIKKEERKKGVFILQIRSFLSNMQKCHRLLSNDLICLLFFMCTMFIIK